MNDDPYTVWETPHGTVEARVYEAYIGLRGQVRVGLVDYQGRVWHYDASELTPNPVMASRGFKLWDAIVATFEPIPPYHWGSGS
jgi:hypothetical protein